MRLNAWSIVGWQRNKFLFLSLLFITSCSTISLPESCMEAQEIRVCAYIPGEGRASTPRAYKELVKARGARPGRVSGSETRIIPPYVLCVKKMDPYNEAEYRYYKIDEFLRLNPIMVLPEDYIKGENCVKDLIQKLETECKRKGV